MKVTLHIDLIGSMTQMLQGARRRVVRKENTISQNVCAVSEAKQLDEARWRAWVAKGRAADERGNITSLQTLKWLAVSGLISVAVLWSRAAPFDMVLRFLVVAAAVAVMLQTLRTRRYLSAALFAALAVLFNPIAPVFGFSGDWQRALLLASAAPFVASLAWRNLKVAA